VEIVAARVRGNLRPPERGASCPDRPSGAFYGGPGNLRPTHTYMRKKRANPQPLDCHRDRPSRPANLRPTLPPGGASCPGVSAGLHLFSQAPARLGAPGSGLHLFLFATPAPRVVAAPGHTTAGCKWFMWFKSAASCAPPRKPPVAARCRPRPSS